MLERTVQHTAGGAGPWHRPGLGEEGLSFTTPSAIRAQPIERGGAIHFNSLRRMKAVIIIGCCGHRQAGRERIRPWAGWWEGCRVLRGRSALGVRLAQSSRYTR